MAQVHVGNACTHGANPVTKVRINLNIVKKGGQTYLINFAASKLVKYGVWTVIIRVTNFNLSHVKIECFCCLKQHQHIFEFHLHNMPLNERLILFKSFFESDMVS